MSNKNQVIQCADLKSALALQEEYTEYVGRDTILDETNLKLTILALPKKYKKKSVREAKAKANRANKVSYEEYNDYENLDNE